jgi:hypothetical protein
VRDREDPLDERQPRERFRVLNLEPYGIRAAGGGRKAG